MRTVIVVLGVTQALLSGCTRKKAPPPRAPEPPPDRVVILTAYERPMMEALLKAYTAARTGVEVETRPVRPGGLEARLAAGGDGADVLLGIPRPELERASAAGRLQPLRPKACRDLEAEHRGPKGDWIGLTVSAIALGANEDLLRERQEPAPLSWKALVEKRYRGWIVVGRPSTTRAARILLSGMLAGTQKRPWRYWKELDRNLFQYVNGPGGASRLLGRGRAMLALDLDKHLLAQRYRGRPIRLSYFKPTPYEVEGVALRRGASNAASALRFVEWLCEEGTLRILDRFRTGVTRPYVEPAERWKPRLSRIRLLHPKRKVDVAAAVKEWEKRFAK